MADKPNREKRPIGVVEIIKGLVVSSLALLSIALLYDVAGYYKGEDIQAKFVVLTIFPAAYLWWIVERVLNRLGLERSREYSLLVAVICRYGFCRPPWGGAWRATSPLLFGAFGPCSRKRLILSSACSPESSPVVALDCTLFLLFNFSLLGCFNKHASLS